MGNRKLRLELFLTKIGVYLAREDKAERFAKDASNRGKGYGAIVIRCQFSYSNAKFVTHSSSAGNWQSEGHDAVRCDDTQLSTNMEWCVSSSSKVKAIAWRDASSSYWTNV